MDCVARLDSLHGPALAEVRAQIRGRPLRGYLAPDRRG
jgi:hypothetical protein